MYHCSILSEEQDPPKPENVKMVCMESLVLTIKRRLPANNIISFTKHLWSIYFVIGLCFRYGK